MSWGVELWDQYDNIASYTNKAIDFLDVFATFVRQRCAIETEYASKIRRLTKNFVPKKTKEEDFHFTYMKAFLTLLNETNDVAGQHEIIADNLANNVANNLSDAVKNLKEQRKKCLIDGTKLNTKLYEQEEQLNKCKKNYEKSHKEAIKAQINYEKANANYDLSRAELDRQKVNAQTKSKLCEDAKAHYALRLREFNEAKRSHYTNYLPAVLQKLQDIESDRIRNYSDFVRAYVDSCKSVLPIITTCYDNVTLSADAVDADTDNRLVIEEYKSGFTVPDDEAFIDLSVNYHHSPNGCLEGDNPNTQEDLRNNFTSIIRLNDSTDSSTMVHNQYVNGINGAILPQQSSSALQCFTSPSSTTSMNKLISNGGSLNILNGHHNAKLMQRGGSHLSNSSLTGATTATTAAGTSTVSHIRNTLSGGKNRLNKKRNLIFNIFTGGNSNQKIEDFSDLPPNQRRKKIISKMDSFNSQLAQEKAGRDAMLRMREVYEKNPSMGDPRAIDGQLAESTQKITKLNNELAKYQSYLHDTESTLMSLGGHNTGSRGSSYNRSQHFGTGGTGNTPPPPPNLQQHFNRQNGPPLPNPPTAGASAFTRPQTNLPSNSQQSTSVLVNGGGSSSTNSTLSSSTNSGGNGNQQQVTQSANQALNDSSTNTSFGGSCHQIHHSNAASNQPPGPLTRSRRLDESQQQNEPPPAAILSSSSSLEGSSPRADDGAARRCGTDVYDMINNYGGVEGDPNDSAADTLAVDVTGEAAADESYQFLTVLGHCLALYDFDGSSEGSVPMKIGQKFEVVELDQGDGWTRVRCPTSSPTKTPTEAAGGPNPLLPKGSNQDTSSFSSQDEGGGVEWIDGFVPTTYVSISLYHEENSNTD